MNPIEELKAMKKELETQKTEKAKAEGILQSTMQRLKSEFNIDTEEEAEKLVSSLSEREQLLTEQINRGVERVKTNYGI